MGSQLLGALVVHTFMGRFVGASPKIQTRLYRAWFVVDTTITLKTPTLTPSIILGLPSPWWQMSP